MNSEITTYRMNDPLTWKEFKKMPDDIKVLYIKALRERYNVPVLNIAEMMGIHPTGLRKELARLNISGKGGRPGAWDKEGFLAWSHGVPVAKEKAVASLENICEPVPVPEIKTLPVKKQSIPVSGSMDFDGSVDAALDVLRLILGGASARIHVSWDTTPEPRTAGCEA